MLQPLLFDAVFDDDLKKHSRWGFWPSYRLKILTIIYYNVVHWKSVSALRSCNFLFIAVHVRQHQSAIESTILELIEPANRNRWITLSAWLVSSWTVKFEWWDENNAVFRIKLRREKKRKVQYNLFMVFWRKMYKKECKDPHARVCLSRLTRVLDINMLEDLQQLEHTGNVARNLEIDSNFKPQRSFFSKSSEKINKIMNRKGKDLRRPPD